MNKDNLKSETSANLFYPLRLFKPAALSDNPSVAIIIRTKDRPFLLARAIQSVLNQEHQNWHIYLVNNGGDQAVVDNILRRSHDEIAGRITQIYHVDDAERDGATNAGMCKIKNEELMILHDDDDSWHPSILRRLIEQFSQKPHILASACTGNFVHETIKEQEVVETLQMPWPGWRSQIDAHIIIRFCCVLTHGFLVRMDVVRDIGFYNKVLPVSGDWEFVLRVFAMGDIAAINEPLAFYHLRKGLMSSDYGNSMVALNYDIFKYTTLMRNAMVRKSINNSPASMGLLHTVLSNADFNSNSVREWIQGTETSFDRLEEKLKRMDSLLDDQEKNSNKHSNTED